MYTCTYDESFVQVSRLSAPAETTSVQRAQVHDAGETAMMRLIPHVRCAFIPIDELRTGMSNEQIRYASQFECYRAMVKNRVDVRGGTSRYRGTQNTPRIHGVKAQEDNLQESLVRVLTYSEDPDAIVAERVLQKKLFTVEDVEKLVAERVLQKKLFTAEDVEKLVAERLKQQSESERPVVIVKPAVESESDSLQDALHLDDGAEKLEDQTEVKRE
jgi:hypothetical protein